MHPIAFTIPIPSYQLGPLPLGPVDIRWYGLMMALSMLVGAWIASILLKKMGRNGELVWDGLFYIILCSIVGARLFYVITNLKEFADGPWWGWLAVWQGGLSFHGGVLGGGLAAYWFFKNKIPFIEIADSFVPGLSFGIILVRIGNFMNGDILGYKWNGPWAMSFPYDQFHAEVGQLGNAAVVIPRHPAEIYGMMVGLICFLVAMIMWIETYVHQRLKVGAAFFGFIITYSLVRSIIEDPFRQVPLAWRVVDPAQAGYGLFTSSQLLSFVLIMIAIVGLMSLKTLQEHREDLSGPGSGSSRQVIRAQKRREK
jgi:phosphatidylglycerol:prolipoprotein diacylglycerol transferase